MKPTITIRGREYSLERVNSTRYVRLACICKPTDGSRLEDLLLDKPSTLSDPKDQQKAIADRTKLAEMMEERLGSDVTSRQLAYALKTVIPELVTDGLVVYKHVIRPDDWAEIEFDFDLEIDEVLDILGAASNYLSERYEQKKAQKADIDERELAPVGFQPPIKENPASRNGHHKPQRRR